MKTNKRILAGLAAATAVLVSVPVSAAEAPGSVQGRVMRRRRKPAGRRMTPGIRLKPGKRVVPGERLQPRKNKQPGIRATDKPGLKPGVRAAEKLPGQRIMKPAAKPGTRQIKSLKELPVKPGLRAAPQR